MAGSSLRVIVTGGSGKIGRFVVRELLERGHQVVNIDRRVPESPSDARFVYADLRDRATIQPLLEQADAVCHLGEMPSVGSNPPEEVFSHNITVASVVLQTAADLRLKRVVYTSTAQVYGAWGEPRIAFAQLPMDETHPLRPQNAYALAKVVGEQYARLMALRHGLSVAVFRFPWVIFDDFQPRWEQWLETEPGPVHEGACTYVHASDLAQAYALALENEESVASNFEVYHFAAADVFSAKPIRQRLLEFSPKEPALPEDWPAYRSPVITDKAHNELGWEPRWSVLEQYQQHTGRRLV